MALGRRPHQREAEAGAGRPSGRPRPARTASSRPRRGRAGCPAPVSETVNRTSSPRRSTVTSTGPSAGPWFRAFSIRLRSARSRAGPSPRTRPGSAARTVTRSPATARASSSSRTGSAGTSAASSWARRSSSSTRRLSRSASARRSSSASWSEPWRARYSAFPRRAASGFRSSCEASAMNRRSPSRARSSAASIRFRVSASRATSSGVCPSALARAAAARDRGGAR